MSNKKTIIGSAAAIVASVALIGGGTFAAWSDFDVVDDQEVAAGTLVVDVIDSTDTPWSATNMAPGDDPAEIIYKLDVSGSTVPGKLRTAFFNSEYDDDGKHVVEVEDGCKTTNTEQAADPDEDDCGAPDSGELPNWTVFELAFRTYTNAEHTCTRDNFKGGPGPLTADFEGMGETFAAVPYTTEGWAAAALSTPLATSDNQPRLRDVIDGAAATTNTDEDSLDTLGLFLDHEPIPVPATVNTVCVYAAVDMPLLSDNANDLISLAQNAAQGDQVKFGLKFQIEQDLS